LRRETAQHQDTNLVHSVQKLMGRWRLDDSSYN
jgi:hypothetical protein